MNALANLCDGIESAAVHVACLHAHDRAIVDIWKGIETHPPLCVDGNTYNPVAPKSHQRQCFLRARVHLIADHHRERRCAKQSMCFNIPAGACQQCVPCGRQCGEVRRRGTGDKPARALRGQMEDLLEPPQRDVLERCIGGRRNYKTGVLIPCGGEPICRDGRRKRPAGDEAKESPTGCCHGGRRTDFIEFSEHHLRAGCKVLKGLIESGKCGKRLRLRCDGARVERFKVAACALRRVVQEVGHRSGKYNRPSFKVRQLAR